MSTTEHERLGGMQPVVAFAFALATVVALGGGIVATRGAANGGAGVAPAPAPVSVGAPPRWADGRVAVPTRYTGPQGIVGQFVAKCLYSHSAPDDPIVWPGRPGRSHLHDFYGATGTNAGSTAADAGRVGQHLRQARRRRGVLAAGAVRPRRRGRALGGARLLPRLAGCEPG